MTALTEYIAKQDRLLNLSLAITVGVLLFIFIIMQLLSFIPLQMNDDREKQMVVQELVRLRFDKKKQKAPAQKFKNHARQNTRPKNSMKVSRKKASRRSKPQVNVEKLLQEFKSKKLVANKTTNRRTVVKVPSPPKSGVSLNVKRQTRGVTDNSLKTPFRSRPARRPSGRKAVAGVVSGAAVEVGAVSPNLANVTSVNGSGFRAARGVRATRSAGNGAGSAQISLPTGEGGGSEATIDLHALIKWMKDHPGPIPKLVAHEMGHERGDLSSRVSFRYRGRQYTFFLSCNEYELFLRVCLVEGNDFILLKDSGIQEESHYLTIGDVIRRRGRIESLISSRKAPGDRAAQFYSIFWAWWQTVEKK